MYRRRSIVGCVQRTRSLTRGIVALAAILAAGLLAGLLGSGSTANAGLAGVTFSGPGGLGGGAEVGGVVGGDGKGPIIVYSSELQPLELHEPTAGCKLLPAGAHIIINASAQSVLTYGDPACIGPALAVKPGYGSHVTFSVGSFQVDAPAAASPATGRAGAAPASDASVKRSRAAKRGRSSKAKRGRSSKAKRSRTSKAKRSRAASRSAR